MTPSTELLRTFLRTLTPCLLAVAALDTEGRAETPPLVLAPGSYDFKDHDIGSTDKTMFKLQNSGTTKITVSRIWIGASRNEFFIDQNPCERKLDPQESC